MAGRLSKIKEINKSSGKHITGTAKKKFSDAKSDPRIIALLFIEFMVVMMLAVGIYVYLDPEIEIIKVGFPFNYIGFAVLIIIAAYIFHLTQWFREYRKTVADK